MAPKRVNRKQLKQPDEFITLSAKVIQWGHTYSRQIGIAAVTFIVIILALVGYRYFNNQSELKAFSLLSQANATYAAQMQENGTPVKVDEDVKGQYEYIINKYSSQDAGKVARKTLADICFNTGQYDQAIDLYERSLKDFENDPFYRSIIMGDLAFAYEASNNNQAAIQHFEMVKDTPNAPFLDEALFHLAGLYEKAGKAEAAHKLYETIIAEHSGSIYLDMVKEKMGG